MKTQPNRHTRSDSSDAGPSPHRDRLLSEQGTDAENLRVRPIILHRRYPSLSDDFMPLFRRTPRTRRPAIRSEISTHTYVRVIALLVIIAIIAALAANT